MEVGSASLKPQKVGQGEKEGENVEVGLVESARLQAYADVPRGRGRSLGRIDVVHSGDR